MRDGPRRDRPSTLPEVGHVCLALGVVGYWLIVLADGGQ